jgi:predicted transcriptional regulator YheO
MSEIAKMLCVSRQTVYNKIDKLNLQQHIQESDKGKILSEEGLNILKKALGFTVSTVNIQSKPVNDSKYMDSYIDTLKSEIEHLRAVIIEKDRQSTEKDKQLCEKDKQIESLTRLIENGQILQRQQQDKILLLEDSQTKQKSSFWDIFKRN